MATYIIGDVQGCYQPLQTLLTKIAFDPQQDRLAFVGDLISRGPDSLSVMRFVMNLAQPPLVVLGNHDLHFLAVHAGIKTAKASQQLDQLLNANDVDNMVVWLRHQPLLCHLPEFNCVMVHAGIHPEWDLPLAKTLAKEVEQHLQSDDYQSLLANMYDDQPACWDAQLRSWSRWRFVINVLTRMRFCNQQGCLDLITKSPPGDQGQALTPWFDYPRSQALTQKIIFGHWAALMGKTNSEQFIGLDTGCVWGHQLTAYRCEDGRRFSV